MDSELKLQKNALRQQMRKNLSTLTPEVRKLESIATMKCIAHYIKQNPQVTSVASFAALESEPDLRDLHELDLQLLYPLSQGDGSMTFHHVDDYHSLATGRYGILEPNPAIHPVSTVEQIDLFLVPAFAYTHDGKRLGKGGGYYDRLLANRSPHSKLLGVCFSCQVLESLPVEVHDIAVDHLISESETT